MSKINGSTPLATATMNNQINQSTVTVSGDGKVTASVGHFGQVKDDPETKQMSPQDFSDFKAALDTAQKAKTVHLTGTAKSTLGSQSGTFSYGDSVIKDIARSPSGGKDVITVRADKDAVETALGILGKYMPGPWSDTDKDGMTSKVSPTLMPIKYEEG